MQQAQEASLQGDRLYMRVGLPESGMLGRLQQGMHAVARCDISHCTGLLNIKSRKVRTPEEVLSNGEDPIHGVQGCISFACIVYSASHESGTHLSGDIKSWDSSGLTGCAPEGVYACSASHASVATSGAHAALLLQPFAGGC